MFSYLIFAYNRIVCKQVVLGHSDGVMCNSQMLMACIAVLPCYPLYMASKLSIIL